jgi:hypothetical protein
MEGTPQERRSEVSIAERAFIRETAVMVHEQTYQKLVAPKLTNRLLDRLEPRDVVRDMEVPYPTLITKPRDWIKELLSTIAHAHFVTIEPVKIKRHMGLRIKGQWSDVMLAERTLLRTMIFVRNYADAAYKSQDKIIRGSRKKWLTAFVAWEQAALGAAYQNLMEQFGKERVEQLVGGFNHVTLPEDHDVDGVRRLRNRRALARAS